MSEFPPHCCSGPVVATWEGPKRAAPPGASASASASSIGSAAVSSWRDDDHRTTLPELLRLRQTYGTTAVDVTSRNFSVGSIRSSRQRRVPWTYLSYRGAWCVWA
jgi:hypothetical protein